MKKVHRVIKFNQNAWLKPYIDMNIDLRKKAKNDLKFFLNMQFYGETMENVRLLVLEPNYHTTKLFTESV